MKRIADLYSILAFCIIFSILGCHKESSPVNPPVEKMVTITATAGDNGTITPSGATQIKLGSSKMYTIKANNNYTLLSIKVDGVDVPLPVPVAGVYLYQIENANADKDIKVFFALITYTVTASAGTGGTVTPSGATVVEYGKDLTLTPTENPEYTLTAIKVNGLSVPVVKPFILTNVTANSDVKFEFTLTNFLILTNGADNKSRYWNWKSSERMDANHVHEYDVNLDQDQLTWRTYYYSTGKVEMFSTAGTLVGNGFWSILPSNIFNLGSQPYTIIECSDKKFVYELKAEFTQGRLEIIRDTYVRQ